MTIRDYLGDSLGLKYYYRHPRNYSRRGIFSIEEPSPTVRGVNRPVPSGYNKHPGDPVDAILSEVRPLTTIERSYLQTFPENFEFLGTKTNLEQMIGNAVPVNLAQFVASGILEFIVNGEVKKQGQQDMFKNEERSNEMQIISVINYKGGVGKTTVTANLAGELAYRGYKVLLLDMDAQASLTFSFVTPDYWDENLEENKTIKNWFNCISEGIDTVPLSDLVTRPSKVNTFLSRSGKGGVIDIISSHLGLINVDLELATLLGGANMTQTKRNYIKVHGKLRSEIHDVAANEYDLVLIDCPPNFNIVTKNALIASDKILVPAKPDYLSTLGIDYLHRSVQTLVDEFNEYASLDSDTDAVNPEFIGVVFTMIQIYSGGPISAQRQYIAQTKRLGVPVLENNFRENKSIFAEAPQNGLPVVLNEYSNNTHSEVVAEIESFVDEFISVTGV